MIVQFFSFPRQVAKETGKSNETDGDKDVPDGEREASQYTVTGDSKKTQDEIIQHFIQKGADVNSKDKHGLTPLHLAAMKGNTPAVNTLLEHEDIDIEV